MRVAGRDTVSAAIQAANRQRRPALIGFLTAGFPARARFKENLAAVAAVCDVVEIGVPFTDPMADGTTIQRASFVALADGVTLPWILDELKAIVPRHPERGAAFAMPRRSVGQAPVAGEVYMADTLGELGLFYRLCPFAFIGGSLVEHGGQNIIEPARLGRHRDRGRRRCGDISGHGRRRH